MIPCNPAQFSDIYNEPTIFTAKCIDVDHPNATIGILERELFTIVISKCVNTTNSNITCKTQEAIDNVFNSHSVGVLYADFSIDPNNFKNPVSYFMNAEGISNSAKLSKALKFILEEVEFVNDKGYFLSD